MLPTSGGGRIDSPRVDHSWLQHADKAVRAPRPAQYSRSVTRPGCGTGYFPLASATKGAGEFIVHLSTSGANSCLLFNMSSNVTSCPVCAAIRPIELTKLASTPLLASLYGLSLRMASTRSFHSFK